MNKPIYNKSKWIPYILLAIFTVFFCWLFCMKSGVFGGTSDWISQHSVLPDYFRRQFYETGRLFPEFAANIGGGQNIYNFSYYGLYSPLFLLSYALPFVKMSDYVMAVQFFCLMASVLLLYQWLKRRGFRENICFGTAVIFLLTGPVIYQSYNQIMFVNYMPFLILAFFCVDRYFENRHYHKAGASGALAISIFLMIMTSFYFSIGGMLALVIYGVYRYVQVCGEQGKKITVGNFLAEGIRFLMPFFTAVLMSGVLLIPTAFALIGRGSMGDGGGSANLFSLLVPRIQMDEFFYSAYGPGFSTLILTVLFASVAYRKCQERVLAWSMAAVLFVPLFLYLLNGGLYTREKVMIPMLPLMCYLMAYYLEKQRNQSFSWSGCIPYLLTCVCIWAGRKQIHIHLYRKLLLLDAVVMLICYIVAGRRKSTSVIMVSAIVCLFLFEIIYHNMDGSMLNRDFYSEMTDVTIEKTISDVAEKDAGFYRTMQIGTDRENAANLNRIWNMEQYISSIYSSSFNEGYQEFRQKTFALEEPFRNFLMQSAEHNPVYQRFMGEKYLISRRAVPGYQLYENSGKWKVYTNADVSPVVYGTNQIITEKEYKKFRFPYSQIALLSGAVVENPDRIQDSELSAQALNEQLQAEIQPVKLKEEYHIDTKEKQTEQVDIPPQKDGADGERVLFLQFHVKNLHPSEDVAVWLSGVRNKLSAENHIYYNGNTTFTYAVALKKGQRQAELTFGRGKYEITDVKGFLGILPGTALYQSEFQINRAKTKGNVIAGRMDMENSGYLITTIPYDKNFEILIDGKKAAIEKVNTAFLGCRMEKGRHQIEILFHAPGMVAGKAVSLAGIAGLLLLVYCDCRKRNRFVMRKV